MTSGNATDQGHSTTYWDHELRPLPVAFPQHRVPTRLEEYLYDLHGYVVLRQVLSAEEVAACNAVIDQIPGDLGRGEWWGSVQREDHSDYRGRSYQQIYEAGEPFEKLIDHPNYINYVLRFVGGQETFDYQHGPLFIDENFVTCRGPGDAIPIHSGGHNKTKRQQYSYQNGRFQGGQVNVLIALTDTRPGDGETMLIPGSHKSNIVHPAFLEKSRDEWQSGGSLDDVAGAISIYQKAGDAIVFIDSCCHGSAKRVNPNERRFAVYRYGSSWNRTRWGYAASPALLGRLSPYAASLVRSTDGSRHP